MKNKIKFALLGVLLFTCAGTAVVARAEFTLPDWQFMRPITLPSVGNVNSNDSTKPASTALDFAKVILPEGISASSKDFNDIRIIDQNGLEEPYILSRDLPAQLESTNANILSQSNIGMGISESVQFIADTGANGEGKIHARIAIGVADSGPRAVKNFKRQVMIYASHKLLPINDAGWSLVKKDGYIFRFTDDVTGMSYGKDYVDFAPNTSRYFKVLVSAGQEGTLSITNVNIFGDESTISPTYTKNVPVTVFNNVKNKTTEVTVDLGKQGVVTRAITLLSPDKNYSRKVVIESSEDGTTWRSVGNGYISHVNTASFDGVFNKVNFVEQNVRYLRASIVNDDNKPITVGGNVIVEGPVESVTFKVEPGQTYSLYYGNPSAVKPQYDLGRISAYIQENVIPVASAGSEVLNPKYVAPKAPVIPFTERNKTLLNVFLIVIVLLVIGGVIWYLKGIAGAKLGMGGNGKDVQHFENPTSYVKDSQMPPSSMKNSEPNENKNENWTN